MRRGADAIASATACAFVALAGAAVWAPALSAQSTDVVARAASVTGRAVLYNGNAAPLALTSGYILSPGDRIDTRGGGRVVVDLSDGSMVVVQPESVIVLKDFRQAGSLRELFDITVGIVRVKINHFGGRPNPYRMNSPTASIAVRGTEFTIEVGVQGDTQVVVYEGAVEVASLSDPSRSTLIEAGRGVLVQAGQDFHFFTAQPNRGGDLNDRNNDAGGSHDRRQPGPQVANAVPAAPPGPQSGPPPATQPAQHPGQDNRSAALPHSDRDDPSPRATASTYDRYIAGLADVGQIPFLFRYNAFAEPHLDSLENPAMATGFTAGEARIFFLPSFSGVRGLEEYQAAFGPGGTLPADYSVSPQFSAFSPVGNSGFVVGGSVSGSRVGSTGVTSMPDPDPSALPTPGPHGSSTTGTATGDFYSGALVAARRFGRNSFGTEAEFLKGTGSLVTTTTESDAQGGAANERVYSASDVTQTRLTAGFSRDLARDARLGLFYRYAFISATDADRSHTVNGVPMGLNSTATSGHSSEFGLRLRGTITPRLSYGVAGAWLQASLRDGLARTNAVPSQARDRAQRGSMALGLGYALTRRAVLSFDVAGGAARTQSTRNESATGATLQNGDLNSHFVSVHTALQVDITRRLFASASLLAVRRNERLNVDLFPDRFGSRAMVVDSFFPITSGAYPLGDRFSDFGVGWRFSPNLFVQYLYSTDYGVSSATHTLMLRYTFRRGRF